MSKKKWEKPKLIVLVKGRPEEAILAGCKGGDFTGAAQVVAQCVTDIDGCGACSTITTT